jgi:hypothetical protein
MKQLAKDTISHAKVWKDYGSVIALIDLVEKYDDEVESWKKDYKILFDALNEIYREGKGRHVEIARKALNEVGK